MAENPQNCKQQPTNRDNNSRTELRKPDRNGKEEGREEKVKEFSYITNVMVPTGNGIKYAKKRGPEKADRASHGP